MRTRTAIVASIALHCVVIAFVRSVPLPPDPPRVRTEQIAVSLAPPPLAPTRSAPPTDVIERPPRRRAAPSSGPAVPSAPPPPPSPRIPPPPGPSPLEQTGHAIGPDIALSESATTTTRPTAPETPQIVVPPAVDLFNFGEGFRVPGGSTPRRDDPDAIVPLPGEGAGREATTEQQRVEQRVAGASIDQSARARVRAGLVSPEYTRLGNAFRDAWDPDRVLPEDSAELLLRNRTRHAALSAELWAETSKRYAATGSPMPDGEELEDTAIVEARIGLSSPGTNGAGGTINAGQSSEVFRQYMRGRFDEGRSALVLVTETPGEPPRVELVKSSGDREIDRGAVEDLRVAMTRLHAESPATSPRRSLWSLRLQIVVNYTPTVMFAFDAYFQPTNVVLPGGRMLLKRIRLEAVYDDEGGAPGRPEGTINEQAK